MGIAADPIRWFEKRSFFRTGCYRIRHCMFLQIATGKGVVQKWPMFLGKSIYLLRPLQLLASTLRKRLRVCE
jgi:hypothetical protein